MTLILITYYGDKIAPLFQFLFCSKENQIFEFYNFFKKE